MAKKAPATKPTPATAENADILKMEIRMVIAEFVKMLDDMGSQLYEIENGEPGSMCDHLEPVWQELENFRRRFLETEAMKERARKAIGALKAKRK